MSNEQLLRRLRPASERSESRSVQDTMTALIQEAHRQKQPFAKGPSAAAQPRHVHFAGGGSPMLPDNLQSLLRETVPTRRLSDLVLPRDLVLEMRELISEIQQTALLRSHSLEPRHTLMLIGPPGTGKTSLAASLATELAMPFLTVRYEGLVGSYLGETALRLQDIIDYATRIPCVLFFDEFDSVGKERSDTQETGEIKRVVSSLLLHMDALPSSCVVVCATNHPELLDRAVWRRFEVRLELPRPGAAELREWLMRTERNFGNLEMTADEFEVLFEGETFSEIEAITLDARRRVVLSHGSTTPGDAFKEAIAKWVRRRDVGGTVTDGTSTDRKNKARARKPSTKAGSERSISEGDLL